MFCFQNSFLVSKGQTNQVFSLAEHQYKQRCGGRSVNVGSKRSAPFDIIRNVGQFGLSRLPWEQEFFASSNLAVPTIEFYCGRLAWCIVTVMGKPEGSCWLCPTQIHVLVTGIWHTFCVQSAKFLSSNLSRDISMRVCREFWHTTYTKNVRLSQFESEDAHHWRIRTIVNSLAFQAREGGA